MEVILLENIKNLGQIGDKVNVKRGYARNYLIKFEKALASTKENIEIVNKKKDQLNNKNLELKKIAQKIFDTVNNTKYIFSKRSKENGELYGSIKPAEVCKSIAEQTKINIRPSQIDFTTKVLKIGSYKANINLHAEVQATIHIQVVEEDKLKS
jgi:large subunit ribosomal protein L9